MNNKLLKNGVYNVAAGAIRVGLAVLTIPILIRLIGVEEYGLWTLASAVVGIVVLAEAGLSVATTVFVSQDLGKEDFNGLSQTITVTFGAMLLLATLAAIVLWFAAEPIVNLFTKLEHTQQLTSVSALQIGSLAVWARLLQQVLVGVEQAYQRYGLMNILNTIQSVLLNLGMLVVAWQGGRIIALMQWQAVTSVAALLSHILVVILLLQNVNLRPVFNLKKAAAIVSHSFMVWMSSLGGVLFLRGDRLIVGSYLGAEFLGIYAAITDALGVINLISSLPVQPLVPILSEQIVKHSNYRDLKLQVKQSIEINGLISFSFSGLLYSFATFVMYALVGEAVNDNNILAFKIATVIYALYSLNAVGYYILLSLAPKFNMVIHLLSGLFSITLVAVGTKHYGLIGSIIGNIGFLGTLSMNLLGINIIGLRIFLWIKILIYPFLWFLFVIIFDLFMPNNILLKIIICLIELIGLYGVYFIFKFANNETT